MKTQSTNAFAGANLFVNALLDKKTIATDGKTILTLGDAKGKTVKPAEKDRVVATLIRMLNDSYHDLNFTANAPDEAITTAEIKALKKQDGVLFSLLRSAMDAKGDKLESLVHQCLEEFAHRFPDAPSFTDTQDLQQSWSVAKNALEKPKPEMSDLYQAIYFWQRTCNSRFQFMSKHYSPPTWTTEPAENARHQKVLENEKELIAQLYAMAKRIEDAQTEVDTPDAPPSEEEPTQAVAQEVQATQEPAPPEVVRSQSLESRPLVVSTFIEEESNAPPQAQ